MSRAARPAERDALEALGSLAVAVGYLLVEVLWAALAAAVWGVALGLASAALVGLTRWLR